MGEILVYSVLSLFNTVLLFYRDTITPDSPLADNETLVSADGSFALGFFNPPNSRNRYVGLWYSKISDNSIIWVANRASPVVSSTGILSVTLDGRLNITSKDSSVIWSSNSTIKLTRPVAQLLDDGNLVVKQAGDNSGNYGWQSFNYPTDTLIPGMKLGVDLTTGINRTLVAWTSPSDPSPGPYHVFLDIRGYPDIYLYQDSTPIYRTGAWDGTHLSGTLDMTTYQGFSFDFVNNSTEVTYSFSLSNNSLLSRLFVSYMGQFELVLWLPSSNRWNILSIAPRDQCDDIGACGPYGLCDSNTAPFCSCLQGFVPRNLANWSVSDRSGGCIKRTSFDCTTVTDEFVTLNNVKLPQSDDCIVDMSMSLGECRSLCLSNCSCTAYTRVNTSDGGSGCIIWIGVLNDIRDFIHAGATLYVRLHTENIAPSKSHKSITLLVAIVGSMVTGILLIACVGCLLLRRKKRRSRVLLHTRKYVKDRPIEGAEENDLDLPLFEFITIEVATDYFSVESKLGEGGFGPVYKGNLGMNQEIAVKRLSKSSQQGAEEFKNEVMLIAKLQHRNLVRLLGCCIQREERILIYEYMPNKSLDAFLFDKTKGAVLDWQTRRRIITGITRGLLYLHHDSRFRIIHRDLKASNVLLDTDMNPKISDFGMARIFRGDDMDFNTRRVVGTYGYMSPEYAMEGIFSVKSDIFSFGVLLLEIIYGKKNRGEYALTSHLNLVAHAWSLWNEDQSLQLVDEALNKSFPVDEVLKYIKIGLLCVQEHPEDRPLISSVIQMLGSDIARLPQPKQPGFVARMCPLEVDPSPRRKVATSNEMTVSMLEGR